MPACPHARFVEPVLRNAADLVALDHHDRHLAREQVTTTGVPSRSDSFIIKRRVTARRGA
jgi:hypothetical protein